MASRSIDQISKKTNCTCSTLFFLISKKTNLHVQHAFCLSLPLFCTTTTLFCRTKTSNFLVTHYFYGGIVVCAYPIFCLLCSYVCFYFSLPLIFDLAGRSLLAAGISHQGLKHPTTQTATRTSKNHQALQAKQQLCTCITLFWTFFCPFLHDYDVKMPNSALYGGRKQAKTKFYLSFCTWIWPQRIQLQEG